MRSNEFGKDVRFEREMSIQKNIAFPITQKMKFSIIDFLSKCDQNSQKIADLVTFSEMFNS